MADAHGLRVVLVSTYELGRQPFGLASPAAWLESIGASVRCLDLAVEKLDEASVQEADLVAFYVPMHTATRLAVSTVQCVQRINPAAHLCFYGLYAPVNEPYLRQLGADTILGGEFEAGLASLAARLAAGDDHDAAQPEPVVSLGRQRFKLPSRSGLPSLERYAFLEVAPGIRRTVGYTEATRGCKHLCRHCPIVPVYKGNFRVVQRDVVLEDIRQQVRAGAEHITFGDPDFFNGPTHAVAIVEALHSEFPEISYDVTIKIEHLRQHAKLLPLLRDTGCAFVTSAVESVDPKILEIFDKRHTRDDFIEVVRRFREIGLTLNPTFVTFTPWTTLRGYLDLLELLVELDLIDNVAPIQYAIRLLIPAGSRLLDLAETHEVVQRYDKEALFHSWVHPDPRVDRLCETVLDIVRKSQSEGLNRRAVLARVWEAAVSAYDGAVSERLAVAHLNQAPPRAAVPYLSEPWYC